MFIRHLKHGFVQFRNGLGYYFTTNIETLHNLFFILYVNSRKCGTNSNTIETYEDTFVNWNILGYKILNFNFKVAGFKTRSYRNKFFCNFRFTFWMIFWTLLNIKTLEVAALLNLSKTFITNKKIIEDSLIMHLLKM